MLSEYVNVYNVGRAYGGAEEGGWWFDCWTPIASIPVDRERVWGEVWASFGVFDTSVEHLRDIDTPDGWQERFEQFMRNDAERIAGWWRTRYPDTGKRGSVLGGDDYDVRVESHFARAGDNYRPWE